MLESIRNFRFRFAIDIAIVLITILTNADITMPGVAHSQFSSSSISKNTNNVNTANNNKVVILTFDDGLKSQYTNAKPILDKYGYKATFDIICNDVGQKGSLGKI
jgi:peptidoglycan/xylan/chitin deacetylase (PgdA/CDA1 family)